MRVDLRTGVIRLTILTALINGVLVPLITFFFGERTSGWVRIEIGAEVHRRNFRRERELLWERKPMLFGTTLTLGRL